MIKERCNRTVGVAYFLRNSAVGVGFFLVVCLINLLDTSTTQAFDIGLLSILFIAFCVASYSVLRQRSRWAVLFTGLSALVWWIVTAYATILIQIILFGLQGLH